MDPQQDVAGWITQDGQRQRCRALHEGQQAMPQCGFSAQVAQILGLLGVNYKDVNVLADMSIREGIKAYSNWPTIPQLYVKGEFVGGCDIVREMAEAGELAQMFDDKGVAYDKSKKMA